LKDTINKKKQQASDKIKVEIFRSKNFKISFYKAFKIDINLPAIFYHVFVILCFYFLF